MNSKCLIPLTVVIAAIFGILSGLVYMNGTIINITTGLWIGLGIAAAVVLILLITTWLAGSSPEHDLRKCLCKYGSFLIVTALGSLVLATIALSIGITVITVNHAILVGLFAGFFAAMVLFLIDLFICIYDRFCPHCECK